MSAPTHLCTPEFAADPGHKDKAKHSASKEGWFYAVVTEDWKGAVTSQEHLDRIKSQDVGVRTFKASTWAQFMELWNVDCAEHHTHTGLPLVDISSDSSYSRAASRVPSPTKIQRRTPSPTKMSRRTPSPTKAVASTSKDLPPFHTANHNVPCPIAAKLTRLDSGPNTADVSAIFEAWATAKEAAPLMFAVSGTNCIFQDRNRAMAAFLATPGAELFYTYNEDAVLEFIDQEAARMLKKKEKSV
ncbi:hypothetical protein B0H19DRAFT_1256953 [Mycena capillaripes]|nr:hypothetical protein B0H19DRAFT_1256953 [Mycena capillaripes]